MVNFRGPVFKFSQLLPASPVWQDGLWSFQTGGTELEIFLHKNQHTNRKILNFEFWINCKLAKIGHHFSNPVF